jgi:hypothetical protein
MKVSWNRICNRQINLNIIEINYHFNYKNVSPYQKHFFRGQSVRTKHTLIGPQDEARMPVLCHTLCPFNLICSSSINLPS